MGAYSEIDIDRRYGNSPFEESDAPAQNIPAFVEAPSMTQPVTPPAATMAEDQAEQNIAPSPVPPAQEADTAPAEAPADTGKPAEPATSTESEDDKKKAHEKAEAKRKDEWEARQKQKKADEQAQLDRLAAMSEDELLEASMKRVSTDTEKLTRRNMMECVAEYIQTMCIEDPAFARKVMHPRKNMIRCYQYINRKAWEYVQDELKAKNITPSRNDPYASAIPEGVCYQWAVDYFNDPDAKEDHEEEEKFVPKPYTGGASKSGKQSKGKSGDKKAAAPKKPTAKEAPKKSAEPTGQLSLGDFVMPEEKAG